jgi:hypothetical protein
MFSFSEKAITLYYFLLNKKSKQGLDYLFKNYLLKKSMKNTFTKLCFNGLSKFGKQSATKIRNNEFNDYLRIEQWLPTEEK